jgi:hypothetical protein
MFSFVRRTRIHLRSLGAPAAWGPPRRFRPGECRYAVIPLASIDLFTDPKLRVDETRKLRLMLTPSPSLFEPDLPLSVPGVRSRCNADSSSKRSAPHTGLGGPGPRRRPSRCHWHWHAVAPMICMLMPRSAAARAAPRLLGLVDRRHRDGGGGF